MVDRARLAAGLGLACVVSLTVSCGYALSGLGTLPEHIKALVILPFENRTQRPEIEQRITEEIASQFSRRGKYEIVTDRSQAQAILEGAVTIYRTTPVQFNSSGRATRIEAMIEIQATLRDLTNDAVIWSQGGLLFRDQFDVPESGEFFDQETLALDDIAAGAAGAVVTSILEGF